MQSLHSLSKEKRLLRVEKTLRILAERGDPKAVEQLKTVKRKLESLRATKTMGNRPPVKQKQRKRTFSSANMLNIDPKPPSKRLRRSPSPSENEVHQKSRSPPKSPPKPKPAQNASKLEDNQSSETPTQVFGDWEAFLEDQYTADEKRKPDWKPPDFGDPHWERGARGILGEWWSIPEQRKVVPKRKPTAKELAKKEAKEKLTPEERRARKQAHIIRQDLAQERKRARIQQNLKRRLETGDVVEVADTADNAFESFFTAAIGKTNDERPEKKEKVDMRLRPETVKRKPIASLANDNLFYIASDDSSNTDDEDTKQPVDIEMEDPEDPSESNLETKDPVKRRNVLSTDVMAPTVGQYRKEKECLKKLNVFDYVVRRRDKFYREVTELNLNPQALVEHWKDIRRNEDLSRNLKKKLGCIMARERVRMRKEKRKEKRLVAKWLKSFDSESSTESSESETESSETESESDTDSSSSDESSSS